MVQTDGRSGGSAIDRRLFLAITVGAAASCLPGAARPARARSPRILTYSDHEPLGGMRTRFLTDVLFPAIERESNGRLRVEGHWNGETAAAYDALGAVSRGATDMATVVPEYSARELPRHQIFKSFPQGPSGSRQVDFFRRVYAEVPAFTTELADNGIVQLFFGTGYPVAFFSTAPLANLDDLKGGRWRSASFWHQDFLRNAGAIPVTMPWGPAIYDALKARSLDGLMVNVDSGYMLKVHEAAPSVLVSRDLWLGHVYLLAMNTRVWGGLPEQDRDAIRRAAGTAHRALGAVMDRSFDAQLVDLRKAGASVRILNAGEARRWQTATRYRDVQAAWAQDQHGKGVGGAASTVATVASIMDDFLR